MNDSLAQITAQQLAEQSSKAMHANDYCAHTLDLKVEEIAPGQATVSMCVQKKYANGHGTCQGGIITTLADTAFAHACNSYNRMTVAQALSIDFLRPALIGERLLAVAVEQSRGKITGVYQVKVFNAKKKLVAIMSGKSFQLNQSVIGSGSRSK